MEFNLCGRQRVLLCREKIIFCHKHLRCISMNQRQFENFHDMLSEMHLITLKAYPLGDYLWFYRDHDSFRLTSHHAYFLFYPESWKCYKRNVHKQIHQIQQRQRDDDENYQYDADNEAEFSPRPRELASRKRRKTFSRKTRNAATSSQQRKKRTTISSRNNSNPRCNPRDCSPEDAMRNTPSSSFNDYYTTSDIKYGSDNPIEEPVNTEVCEE